MTSTQITEQTDSTEHAQHGEHKSDFNPHQAKKSRKRDLAGLFLLILLAGGGYAAYWHFIGSRYITTDNAYADAEVSTVTPAIGGIIKTVNVVNTQHVEKGDVLVVIDDTDAKIAVAQAEAEYALAKRQFHSTQANDEGLEALVKAREEDEKRALAQLDAAQADFNRATVDLNRRKKLIKSGSVSGEELTNAKTALSQARAGLNAAKAAVNQAKASRLSTIGNQKANAAMIADTTVDNNPQVLLAKAHLDQANINLARTVVRAPVSGIIAQRNVQAGQLVHLGAVLMTVVPLEDIYVNANFKEGQLRKVKPEQQVKLTADLYGDDVVYHGVIKGFSGGTGSAFSMIPAQNATGNWIKVVQRLPVRIEIASEDLQAHPLKVGLSMEATIDLRPNKQ